MKADVTKIAWIIAAVAALTSAACTSSNPKSANDPVLQAESSYDIAKDLWLRQNRPRQALAHALEAVDMDPDNADAAHLVALIYLRFCEQNETRGGRTQDECLLDEAERHARMAVESKKDYREAKNTLGLVLIHRKQHAEAVRVLRPLAEDILYQTPEIAWGNLGWAYLEMGKHKSAIRALERSVASEPGFCVGWYRLGLARKRAKNLAGAEEAFTEALTRDARCAGLQAALLERGRVRHLLRKPSDAREDLERCTELDRRTRDGKECAALLANLKYSRGASWSRSGNTFAKGAKKNR